MSHIGGINRNSFRSIQSHRQNQNNYLHAEDEIDTNFDFSATDDLALNFPEPLKKEFPSSGGWLETFKSGMGLVMNNLSQKMGSQNFGSMVGATVDILDPTINFTDINGVPNRQYLFSSIVQKGTQQLTLKLKLTVKGSIPGVDANPVTQRPIIQQPAIQTQPVVPQQPIIPQQPVVPPAITNPNINNPEWDALNPVQAKLSMIPWTDLDGDGDADMIMYWDGKISKDAVQNAVDQIEAGSGGRLDIQIRSGDVQTAYDDPFMGSLWVNDLADAAGKRTAGMSLPGIGADTQIDVAYANHSNTVLHELMHAAGVEEDINLNQGDSIMDYRYEDDILTNFDKGMLKTLYGGLNVGAQTTDSPDFV